MIQFCTVTSGKSMPWPRPAAISAPTAGGIRIWPTRAGKTSRRPAWCRYCNGDVSQTNSAKARFLPEFLFGLGERVDGRGQDVASQQVTPQIGQDVTAPWTANYTLTAWAATDIPSGVTLLVQVNGQAVVQTPIAGGGNYAHV